MVYATCSILPEENEAQVKQVVDAAAARFSSVIDMLVNVAGVAGQSPVEEITVGMRVTTRDHGPQPVLWHASRVVSPAEMTARPQLRPVELRAEAFGNPRPLRLSALSGGTVHCASPCATAATEGPPPLYGT